MFRCKVCGWLHAGDTPPDSCPACGSPPDRFRPVATGLRESGAGSTNLRPGSRLRLLAFVPATIDSPFARHEGPRLDVVTGDGAWFDDNIPCMRACPVNTDVATYIGHVAGGAFGLAAQLNREQNVFAGTLGRTCSRPCEDACRRTVIDSPIRIRALKRVATDHEALAPPDTPATPAPAPATGKRVAVVGAGVAGLTVARELRLVGHTVTVFERDQAPGGLMVSGVPAWRLPREVAETDIGTITGLGVTVETGRELGRDLAMAELSTQYEAVVVATGAQVVARLPETGTSGLDAADPVSGVTDGLAFLRHVASGGQRPTGPVLVVGGGYTAFDCARTARRLAQGPVTIAMRQGVATSVVADELADALAEGVTVLEGLALVGVERVGSGINGAVLRDDAGAEQRVPCSLLIEAIGQEPDWSVFGTLNGAAPGDRGGPARAWNGRVTGWPNVWLAGDVIDGSTSFIDAIASGKRTAATVAGWLGQPGAARPTERIGDAIPVLLDPDRPATGMQTTDDVLPSWTRDLLHRRVIEDDPYREIDRRPSAVLDVTDRGLESGNPAIEVDGGMTAEIGEQEAARCLQCQANIFIDGDRCILCNGCVDVCPYGCIEMFGLDRLASVDGSSLESVPGLNRQSVAMLIDEDACIRCGKCVDWCPTSCLTMSAHRPTRGGQASGFDIRSLLATD